MMGDGFLRSRRACFTLVRSPAEVAGRGERPTRPTTGLWVCRFAWFGVLVALAVAVAAHPARAADAAEWKAGTAAVKITPEQPMWMSGYAARTKPAEGTLNDLY